MDNTEKITETEFIEKIQQFYAQLQARWGSPIQPSRVNINNSAQRLEYAFVNLHTNVIGGQVAFIWWNKITGSVGWSMNQPNDIVKP